ncbi:MAG: hypothetical protein RLZZ347_717 [Candidatus Parcubacteria bacterium]|jgi:hypothetical protein
MPPLFENLSPEFWILLFVIGFSLSVLFALYGHLGHARKIHRRKHHFYDHTMAKHKKEIMHYAFLHDGVVTNNIVELLCRVHSAKADVYLKSLEDEKKLKCIGKKSGSVFYQIV